MSQDQPILEMRGIEKSFFGVKVLKDVDFALARGEVHALLGENGAGKSTLIKILNGDYSKDGGEIVVDSAPVIIDSPRDAEALGIRMIYQGLYALSRACHAEGLQIADQVGDKWGVAWSHMGLGLVAVYHQDFTTAADHFAQSLALRRELGDHWGVARSLNGLGDSARYQGDTGAARGYYEQSLALHRQMKHKGFLALVLRNYGEVLQLEGQPEKATTCLMESLHIFHEQGRRVGVAWCLIGLAACAASQDLPERAIGWLGAAESIFAASGYQMDAVESSQFQRKVTGLENKLGRDRFEVFWAGGYGMLFDEVVSEVLK